MGLHIREVIRWCSDICVRGVRCRRCYIAAKLVRPRRTILCGMPSAAVTGKTTSVVARRSAAASRLISTGLSCCILEVSSISGQFQNKSVVTSMWTWARSFEWWKVWATLVTSVLFLPPMWGLSLCYVASRHMCQLLAQRVGELALQTKGSREI